MRRRRPGWSQASSNLSKSTKTDSGVLQDPPRIFLSETSKNDDSTTHLCGFSDSRASLEDHRPTQNTPRNHSESMCGKVTCQTTYLILKWSSEASKWEPEFMNNSTWDFQGTPLDAQARPNVDQASQKLPQGYPRHRKPIPNDIQTHEQIEPQRHYPKRSQIEALDIQPASLSTYSQ